MGKNSIVMKSKQIVCDILGLVLDMEMEMRLSRFVAAFNRGEFQATASGQRSHPGLSLAASTEWEALVDARWGGGLLVTHENGRARVGDCRVGARYP
jgi:hypothetical protein